MKEYLGLAKRPLIGSKVYLEAAHEGDGWRGELLEIRENCVIIQEDGKRKLVPFRHFLNMVCTDDVQVAEGIKKPSD